MSTKTPIETCGEEKRDPRVVRTRGALDDALKSLLMERRFDEITVQDIAGRAGVNRATFYAHFQDKYDLLEASLTEGLHKLLFAAVKPGSAFNRENLKVFTIAIFDFLRKVSGGCARRQEFGPLLETTVQGTIHEALTHWMGDDPSSPLIRGQSPEMVATVYSWTLFGAGIRWARMEKPPKVDVFTEEVLNVLIGA